MAGPRGQWSIGENGENWLRNHLCVCVRACVCLGVKSVCALATLADDDDEYDDDDDDDDEQILSFLVVLAGGGGTGGMDEEEAGAAGAGHS